MSKINIITSCYNDHYKLSWSGTCKELLGEGTDVRFFIYQKNDQLDINERIVRHIDNENIEIPNIGRCDYAFLLYIVENYENLAEFNIFTKVNWGDQAIDFSDLVRNSQMYDFCDVGDLKEIQIWETAIIDSDPYRYLSENGYAGYNHQVIDHRKNKKTGHYHHSFRCDCINDWYLEIFGDETPPSVFWSWCHGPCFSVSRDLILRHKKSVYEYLLSRFHPDSKSWDNDLGREILSRKLGGDITDEKIMGDVGKHYHDNLQRFWRILFTHSVDTTIFKIRKN